MKRIGLLILGLGIAIGGGCSKAQEPGASPLLGQTTKSVAFQKVREPAVAGLFYPKDKEQLTKMIDAFLAEVKPAPVNRVRGLVCPHAGYEYSGKTAAAGYKLLPGQDLRTVIVMAPSHYADFEGGAIPDADAYATPLGAVGISARARELAKLKPFAVNPPCQVARPGWWQQASKELPPFGEDTPHTWEHAVEVQVPFLQRTLPNAEIVPVVFGRTDPEDAARVLSKFLDDKTLLVASSDLSHYYDYETAKSLDSTCVKAICGLNIEWMEQQEACGKVPVLVLMHIARQKHWQAKLLECCNSGDVTGDKSRVVGYAAVAFYEADQEPAGAKPARQSRAKDAGAEFAPQERKILLELARKAVRQAVGGGDLPALQAGESAQQFTEPRACFVTLTKNGELRGCIGSIFPREPLYLGVLHMAQSAAIRDPRFTPVKADELDAIQVEVSVLSLPQRLEFSSPEDLLQKLRPHVDGVVLRVGQSEATFLPQVWEQLPDKEAFLTHLSRKANLAPDVWRRPEAKVLVYQVEAFKESEM